MDHNSQNATIESELAGSVFRMLEESQIGVWQWEIATDKMAHSKRIEEMIGYAPEETPAGIEAARALVYPPDREMVQRETQRCLNGEIPFYDLPLRLQKKDGSVIWVRAFCSGAHPDSSGKPTILSGMLSDITAVKLEEERLRAENSHLQHALRLAGLGTWEWDLRHDHISFSSTYEDIIGYTPEELNGPSDAIAMLIPQEDHIDIERDLASSMASGGIFRQEIKARRKGGEYIWLLSFASVVEWDETGRPTCICGGVLDIDMRVRAEQALRESLAEEERYSERLRAEVENAVHGLEQTRRMNAAMLDGNPHISLMFDDEFQMIDCNPKAVEYFGFDSKDAFLRGGLEFICKSIPAVQPTGRVTVPIERVFRDARLDGHVETETELVLNGKVTSLSVVITRIPYDDSFVYVCYLVDLNSLREAKHELLRQDRLLQAVNTVASDLISANTEDFELAIWKSLKLIGETTGADRCYIWQNFQQGDKLFCTQTFEWSEGAEPQQGKDFTVDMDYDRVPYWRDSVMSGTPINSLVRNLPDPEREALQAQGIVTILVIPISLEGRPWGFIGFDDCKGERVFTELEQRVLHSAGILMVSALARNSMTERLISARNDLLTRDKLLRAVNKAATLLMGDVGESFRVVINRSLRVLCESVDYDRAYIWRNSTVNGQLCCSELAEWARYSASTYGKIPAVCIPYDELIPSWQYILQELTFINAPVSELDETLIAFPGMQDVQSLVIIPIILQGEFWGFVGFDNCHSEQVIRQNQVDILKSGGLLIASAVLRNEMTESLIEAKEAALASMKAKSEFLSRMSHEIRTPMNAIIGMTAIARKSGDLEKVQTCLSKVDSSSRQLLAIINDVLDMSKIDANKLEIEPHEFDFEKMMENIFNVIQVRVEEKRLDFQFDFEQVFERNVISDELRLSQVIINLLANAVKFTPENGRVTLRVRQTPTGGDRSLLHVEVTDSGIGIEAERIPALFQSFEQADGSITRQYGGTGLGLAISKNIVGLMGGDIYVESVVGEGSSFIFDVEIGWGAPRQAAVAAPPLRHDLRILVVDDVEDVRDYFRNILASFSLGCDTAADGREAVRMVREALEQGEPYNLIFLDWYMPGAGGAEAAREIKRIMSDNIIVVMISVTDWADIEQEAQAIGIDLFLSKPVFPSVLYNTLVRLTNRTFVREPEQPAEATYDWSGKQILLVEDIEINREIVLGILDDTGLIIDCAGDGAKAVEMYRQAPERYQMILMDVQMPIMDGLAATRAIRASGVPGCAEIPIVAMTANAFKEDAQNCIAAGMNGHIAKPIEVQQLYDTLTHYLG